MLQQRRADLGHAAPCHVDHQRLAQRSEPLPVRFLVAPQVGGDEGNGVGRIPVGEWNPGVGTAAAGGGDARHDLKREPGIRQGQGLFTAPAEDIGITAFEPANALPGLHPLDQQSVDGRLGGGGATAGLAHVDQFRVPAGVGQQGRGDQPVVEHHIRVLQQVQAPEGEQLRRAGTGAYQPGLARSGGAGFSPGLILQGGSQRGIRRRQASADDVLRQARPGPERSFE